jgi:hypothetical protein
LPAPARPPPSANELPLANYFRAKNLQLVVMVDATDGLNRSAEAPELVQLGRSISEPAVQQAYRQFVLALSSIIHPDYLGLVAETNLIRLVAPASLYASLGKWSMRPRTTCSSLCCEAIREHSGGRGVGRGRNNVYRGVERDFADFPFMQALDCRRIRLRLDPEEIPRLLYRLTVALPLMVEGGWTSGTAGAIVSSPEEQALYIRRQALMLDSARAKAVSSSFRISTRVAQLPGSILPLFARLGLVDASCGEAGVVCLGRLFAVRRTPVAAGTGTDGLSSFLSQRQSPVDRTPRPRIHPR